MSALRNLEEKEVSSHSTEVLQDVKMKAEAHDEPEKKIEQNPFPRILKLNVGGTIFLTSSTTLINDASSGSMLEAMFSGGFDTKPSEDGSYFIDRDGTHFRYILNYLRNGQLIVPEDKPVLLNELLAEAQFYRIEGIIKKIKQLKARALRDSVLRSSEPGVSNR